MSDKKLIAPSMLAADFSNLAHDIALVNQSDADWFHLDVMDGVFVPNISFGMPVIKSMAKHTTKPLDVHLSHKSNRSMFYILVVLSNLVAPREWDCQSFLAVRYGKITSEGK